MSTNSLNNVNFLISSSTINQIFQFQLHEYYSLFETKSFVRNQVIQIMRFFISPSQEDIHSVRLGAYHTVAEDIAIGNF